jgi:hypothetical protein
MLPRRTLRRFACLCWLVAGVAVAGAAVHYDMPKAELLKELGKPTSTLKHPGSGREVLNYPNGVRIELEKGVVVSIKGLDMVAVDEATKAAAAEKAAAEEQARIEKEIEDKAKAEAAAKAAPAVSPGGKTAPVATAPAGKNGTYTMEQAVAALEKREAHKAAKEEKDYKKAAAVFSLARFFVELLLGWVVMVLGLKLTAKYWSVDIDWSGILLAAAAETGTSAAIGLIGEYVFHTTSLYYLDRLAATIVLILVLRKVSTNQSLNQAVSIAIGSRLFTMLVKVLLFTLVLNAMF